MIHELRCGKCAKKLAEYKKASDLRIKCPRCKYTNKTPEDLESHNQPRIIIGVTTHDSKNRPIYPTK